MQHRLPRLPGEARAREASGGAPENSPAAHQGDIRPLLPAGLAGRRGCVLGARMLMPPAVTRQNHLASVMQRRGSDAPEPVFDSTMGRSALLQQEQNTISLFKARSASRMQRCGAAWSAQGVTA